MVSIEWDFVRCMKRIGRQFDIGLESIGSELMVKIKNIKYLNELLNCKLVLK